MTASGAVLSYPWASNLVYRVAGSPVPAGRGGGPGGGPRAAGGGPPAARGGESQPAIHGRGPGEQNAERSRRRGGAAEGSGGGARAPQGNAAREGGPRGPEGGDAAAGIIPADIDRVWARAEQQIPTWSLISMRLPNWEGGPAAFTITDGAQWNAFARSNLALNSANAEVVQWQPYDASNLGQKARGWLRFAHTGELGGLTGQIIAGLGCLGGVFLVYTGLALAWRRMWNWSLWKRLGSRRPDPLGVGSSAVSREPVMD
jgi:uncharacterized iron-regulated membrane protein